MSDEEESSSNNREISLQTQVTILGVDVSILKRNLFSLTKLQITILLHMSKIIEDLDNNGNINKEVFSEIIEQLGFLLDRYELMLDIEKRRLGIDDKSKPQI